MKNIKFFCIIALIAIMAACPSPNSDNDNSGGGTTPPKPWVDPATQTTPLTGGTKLLNNTHGHTNLPGSPYSYSTFVYDQSLEHLNTFTWYGANQGGGGAFRVDWGAYILARLGFYWGNGGKYTQYNNIYVDYNYKRTGSAPWGFIGVYGWFRNPSAAKDSQKLIEYYIVDDWFDAGQLDMMDGFAADPLQVRGSEKFHGTFVVDGATYHIYTNERTDLNIDVYTDKGSTFTQVISVRQGRRTHGTISVTEHFKAWSKYVDLGNIFEAMFKVEAGGGNGSLDLTYLYLSQEVNRRNIPAGTTPVDWVPGGGETVLGSYAAFAGNPHNNLTSPSAYQVVNLTSEGKTNVLKVSNPGEWAVALSDLASHKDKTVTINFSADVKRVGAAGNLQWQVNNSDYPAVGSPVNNAAAGTWHNMSGQWTGIPAAEYPSLYLSTHENNSASTVYYISNFSITVTP